jgi:hypothetical protein
MDYGTEFGAAIDRTRRWGLIAPAIEQRGPRVLTESVRKTLDVVVDDSLGPLAAQAPTWRRLETHYRLLGPLTGYLRVPLCYTIGWVSVADEDAEGLDEADLRLLLARRDGCPVRLHAWLTLPSHEIVDASCKGQLICGHPAELNLLAYHPLLVGVDFLWRVGVIGSTFAPQSAPTGAFS